MNTAKDKKILLEYLERLIDTQNNFRMPSFSNVVKNSKYFNENISFLINFTKYRKENYKEEMKFDQIILTSYFSSQKVLNKIKRHNYKKLKKFEINVKYKSSNGNRL